MVLTLSQGRCPWRERLLRRGWPSELYPDGPSCTVYRAISAHGGGYGASWQYADHDTFLEEDEQENLEGANKGLVLFDARISHI